MEYLYPGGLAKAITFSYDDGQVYDRRLIEIFNQAGFKGTFHLNSGNLDKDGYVQKATSYISANYSYPITVEDVAAYVGLSRSHLFRSFEKVLQCSPKEYLTDFRIRQACALLKQTDLSVTAIANSVGFENNLYFSKAFHKIKGISPKKYRTDARAQIP